MYDEEEDRSFFLLILGVLAGVIAIVCWWALGQNSTSDITATGAAAAEAKAAEYSFEADDDVVVLRGVVANQEQHDQVVARADSVFEVVVDELEIDPERSAALPSIVVARGYTKQEIIDQVNEWRAERALQNLVNELAVAEIIDEQTAPADDEYPAVPDEEEPPAEEVVVEPSTEAMDEGDMAEDEMAEDEMAEDEMADEESEFTDEFEESDATPSEDAQEAVDSINDLFALEPIEFDSGSASITTDSQFTLDQAVITLGAYPDVKVEIQGYTDDVGQPEANLKLSQARAEAVLDYLAEAGINRDRLSAVGYGEADPVASNDTAEGRAQNRRIQFELL